MMLANNYMGISEALVYGYKAGLDLEQMIKILREGAANTFLLDHQGENAIKREFSVGFAIDLFVKDVSIGLEEARNMGIALPGLA